MKKIAADRNYRMLKSADIGMRGLDAPLSNPPFIPSPEEQEQIEFGAHDMACKEHGTALANEKAGDYMEKSKQYFIN